MAKKKKVSAEEKERRRIEEENAVTKTLKQLGLGRKFLAKDGNCLFRAIADQVFNTTSVHNYVRQQCVDYIEANKEEFEAYIFEMPFDVYCKKMRRLDCWGGQVELEALSRRFQCNIVVYTSRGIEAEHRNAPAASASTSSNSMAANKDILLCFCHGNHYDSVYREQFFESAAVCQDILYDMLSDAVGIVDPRPKGSFRNVEYDIWVEELEAQREKDKKLAMTVVDKMERNELEIDDPANFPSLNKPKKRNKQQDETNGAASAATTTTKPTFFSSTLASIPDLRKKVPVPGSPQGVNLDSSSDAAASPSAQGEETSTETAKEGTETTEQTAATDNSAKQNRPETVPSASSSTGASSSVRASSGGPATGAKQPVTAVKGKPATEARQQQRSQPKRDDTRGVSRAYEDSRAVPTRGRRLGGDAPIGGAEYTTVEEEDRRRRAAETRRTTSQPQANRGTDGKSRPQQRAPAAASGVQAAKYSSADDFFAQSQIPAAVIKPAKKPDQSAKQPETTPVSSKAPTDTAGSASSAPKMPAWGKPKDWQALAKQQQEIELERERQRQLAEQQQKERERLLEEQEKAATMPQPQHTSRTAPVAELPSTTSPTAAAAGKPKSGNKPTANSGEPKSKAKTVIAGSAAAQILNQPQSQTTQQTPPKTSQPAKQAKAKQKQVAAKTTPTPTESESKTVDGSRSNSAHEPPPKQEKSRTANEMDKSKKLSAPQQPQPQQKQKSQQRQQQQQNSTEANKQQQQPVAKATVIMPAMKNTPTNSTHETATEAFAITFGSDITVSTSSLSLIPTPTTPSGASTPTPTPKPQTPKESSSKRNESATPTATTATLTTTKTTVTTTKTVIANQTTTKLSSNATAQQPTPQPQQTALSPVSNMEALLPLPAHPPAPHAYPPHPYPPHLYPPHLYPPHLYPPQLYPPHLYLNMPPPMSSQPMDSPVYPPPYMYYPQGAPVAYAVPYGMYSPMPDHDLEPTDP